MEELQIQGNGSELIEFQAINDKDVCLLIQAWSIAKNPRYILTTDQLRQLHTFLTEQLNKIDDTI